MSRSRWAVIAQKVILETAAGLPAEASAREVRKALSAAYPFGHRSQHPYRIWCRCVREYIERRFPEVRRERERARLQAQREELDRRGLLSGGVRRYEFSF